MKNFIKAFKTEADWCLLLCFSFFSAISMPIARIFLGACLLLVLRNCIRGKQKLYLSLPSKGWFAYTLFAFIITLLAVFFINDPLLNPLRGIKKIDKFIWYLGIPIVATLVNNKERFVQILRWYVSGCVIAAILVFVTYTFNAWVMCNIPKESYMTDPSLRETVPLAAQWLYDVTNFLGIYDDIWNKIHMHFYDRPDSFSTAFLLQGTMHESQRLMVAIPAAFVVLVETCKQKLSHKQIIKHSLALLLISFALVFTCKRGPLIVAAIVTLPIAFCYYKRLTILFVGLLITFLLAIPTARMRMGDLSSEFTLEKGGRYAMWTQIVPQIHEEHPYGIGFMTLTTEKMRNLCPNMENLPHSHVHSTPLQVFVEFSWVGLFLYMLWCVFAIYPAIIYLRRGGGLFAGIPLVIVLSLFLFGFVEYNLADSEVVLLYSLGMGLCDCMYLKTSFRKQNS